MGGRVKDWLKNDKRYYSYGNIDYWYMLYNTKIYYLITNYIIFIMQTANLLARVGDQGSFQIFSIAFVCVKWLVVSLMIFIPSYLFIIPTFTCGDQINVK